jgi:hypothetical protein
MRLRLGHGQENGLVGVLRAALGDGVEKAHRVELVAEELRAHGVVAGGREDVEDAAAQRELPDALDERRARVARADELFGQLVQVILGARAQRDGG